MATATSSAPSTKLRGHRKPWWRRTLPWVLVTVASVGTLAVFRLKRGGGEKIGVQITNVRRGTVRDYVTSTTTGRIAGKVEATLRADIMGTVRSVHKKRGDKVVVGEALLTYDADELGERLRLSQSSIEIARAQARQAQESAAVVETNLARALRLKQSGSIAEAEVETLQGQALVASRTLDTARAGVTQAYASVELAKSALAKAVVRAPFSGTLISTSVEVGETTSPGAPLFQIADASAPHVDAEIDEADLGRITIGMPADITFDAFPNERMRGKLTEIAPSVSRDQRGGRSVAVEIQLPSDSRLRIGMSADVDIVVSSRADVLFVPPNAVVGRGTERSVYVVKNGVAQKRTIEVGVSTWEAVEIKSGLNEGDEVVSSLISSKLVDGVPVKVLPAGASK